MLPTNERFACKLPTHTRICLSLLTKGHFSTKAPPLHITQNLQLAQFRYRLSTNQNNIIPHTLYVREQHARAITHDDTMGRRMHQAICQVDRDRIDPHTPMPPSVQQAKPQNHEKSYRKILESDAAPPIRITRPPRSVKSIRTLASQQRHLGQEPV